MSFAFCISCATSTLAVFAVFLRFVNGNNRVWEALGGAAFGVYVLHYAFVSWFQFWLVPIAIPARASLRQLARAALHAR